MKSSTMMCLQNRLKSEDGFTLIEIMIAIGIFAIGYLAVAMMQVNALNTTNSGRRTTEAVMIAEDWSEHLRALPFYNEDQDLDEDGSVDDFDMHPNLSSGDHPTSTDGSIALTENTPYTVRWRVSSPGPLPDFSAGILDDTDPVCRSLNIRVWVTPDSDPNDIQAEIIFGKFWAMDKQT